MLVVSARLARVLRAVVVYETVLFLLVTGEALVVQSTAGDEPVVEVTGAEDSLAGVRVGLQVQTEVVDSVEIKRESLNPRDPLSLCNICTYHFLYF